MELSTAQSVRSVISEPSVLQPDPYDAIVDFKTMDQLLDLEPSNKGEMFLQSWELHIYA